MAKLLCGLWLTVGVTTAGSRGPWEPTLRCKECVQSSVRTAPGVGFDLGFDYGTAAVHFFNGSIVEIAQISAPPEYVQLMRRLAVGSRPPPLTRLQRYRRWLNKRLGYPSTPGVGTLSSLVAQLHEKCQEVVGAMDRVMVTNPILPALLGDDVNDALEFVGLRPWVIPYSLYLRDDCAVFAANGHGLCDTYRDVYQCRREELQMPEPNVYTVKFTHNLLYATMAWIQSPFAYHVSREGHYFLDHDAGLDSAVNHSTPDQYWSHIESLLSRLPQESQHVLDELQLAGDCATNPRFLSALRNALAGNGVRPQVMASLDEIVKARADAISLPAISMSPTFAAARGAALYARRRQEAPDFCVEPARCNAERQSNSQEGRGPDIDLR